MKYNRPRGTVDITPENSEKWIEMEQLLRTVAANYNVKEMRTPIFEHTELFSRAVGDTTDVVTKEMYTFKDKGDRSLTLRPEGTAGIARAYVEDRCMLYLKSYRRFTIWDPCSDMNVHKMVDRDSSTSSV